MSQTSAQFDQAIASCSDIFIKKTHNCYAYALNMINKKYSKICKELNKNSKNNCIFLKPQVGMYSGNYDNSKLTCEKMKIRLIKDNPKIKPINKPNLNDFGK